MLKKPSRRVAGFVSYLARSAPRPLGPRAETGGKNGGGRLLCPWGVELGPIQRLFSAVRVFPGLSGFPRDRVLAAAGGVLVLVLVLAPVLALVLVLVVLVLALVCVERF